MDISVIIATYKRASILVNAFESFVHLNTDGLTWEIILADNAGDQETKNLVDKYSDRLCIKYIVEKRQGKTYALNSAIGKAQGELFVFTDDDIIADKNWLKEMWVGAGRWPNASVFGGKILPRWPQEQAPLEDIQQEFFNAAYVIADWDCHEGHYDAGRVWGPNMALRKKILDQGWRFKEGMGPKGNNYLVGDETDLTKRLEKAGVESVYLPKAQVLHQIREEQMTPKWLCKRAFIHGRSDVYYDKRDLGAKMFLGAPRYLYRVLAGLIVKRMISLCSFNKAERINVGIRYWTVRGYIYQYRLAQFRDQE